MKAIPNLITACRVVFSMILLFLRPLGTAFLVVYCICGFSDILDGFIARKAGVSSTLGGKLDSAADMIMIGVLLFIIFPIANPSSKIILWILSIGIIRLVSVFVALKKYKTFASVHTYGNKATGLVIFISPFILHFVSTALLMNLICIVATISGVEELIIQLTSTNLNINRHSIFEWI